MTYVIAEIGFNHEGERDLAREMIRRAAEAGADAVKFQSFRGEDLALPSSEHFAAVAGAAMSPEMHREFKRAADEAGIDFLSTPFGAWAVELLEELGVPAYKVASMDATNHVLLGRIAATGKPVYLSTGMALLEEIRESLAFLRSRGAGPVTVLHCTAKYPPEASEVNLAAMTRLAEELAVPVGYSDHYPGIEAAAVAAAMGAAVIETHFTLDTARSGGDHGHSADPETLAELVRRVRLVETLRGRPVLDETRPDREMAPLFRRGLHAARDLPAGTVLAETDLQVCRPQAELGPNDLERLIGRTLSRDLAAGEALTADAL